MSCLFNQNFLKMSHSGFSLPKEDDQEINGSVRSLNSSGSGEKRNQSVIVIESINNRLEYANRLERSPARATSPQPNQKSLNLGELTQEDQVAAYQLMTEKKNTSKLQEISYNLTSDKDFSPDAPHLNSKSPAILKQSEVTIQSSPLSSSMNKVNWESSP